MLASPRVQVIVGNPGSGKTTRLAQRIARLLQDGCDPAHMLVVCARASAMRRMAGLIEARAGEVARGVRVTTAQQAALEVLAQGNAAGTGTNPPRLLSPAEEPFFIEDVMTCGIDRKRLRELLRFLERGMTELAGRDPHWLISQEERTVWELAHEALSFMGATHPCEVSSRALELLEQGDEARLRCAYPHVFVDDFDACNRASQALLRAIALQTLTIAWGTGAHLEGDDPYPYVTGIDELCAGSDVTVEELAGPGSAFRLPLARGKQVESIVGHYGPERHTMADNCGSHAPSRAETDAVPFRTEPTAVTAIVAETPLDEAARIADLLRSEEEAGTPLDLMAVVAPDHRWARTVRRALEAEGLPCSSLDAVHHLLGDPRRPDGCESMRLYAALRLAADPCDSLAWRCWCGFGDHLLASLEMGKLRTYAAQAGRTLPQALADLAAGRVAITGCKQLVDRYRSGLAVVEAASGLRGRNLLDCLQAMIKNGDHLVGQGVATGYPSREPTNPQPGRPVDSVHGGQDAEPASSPKEAIAGSTDEGALPSGIAALLGGLDIDALYASELVRRIDAHAFAPAFLPATVMVGTAEDLLGQRASTVVLAGSVNGLTPPHAALDRSEATPERQARMLRLARGRLEAAGSKADVQAVVSRFESAPLEVAERFSLKVERIFVKDGTRMARVSPSVLLEERE